MHKEKALAKPSPFFTISFTTNQQNLVEYYKNENADLKKRFEDFKSNVNQIIEKGKYIDAVEKFRDMNLIKCFIDNNFKITLFQCKDKIDNGKCKMFKICKTRIEFLNKILTSKEILNFKS